MFRASVNILASACLLLTASVSYAAEGVLETFTDAFSSACLAFDYTYGYEASGVKFTGNGNIILNGDSFIMKGDGLEIYCDGTVKWTVDRSAAEAVVETFDGENIDYLANPALLLGNVSQAFSVTSEKRVEYCGRNATEVRLQPLTGMGGIESASIFFSDDLLKGADGSAAMPVGAELDMDDGTVIGLSLSSFAVLSEEDVPVFSFDGESLGDGYIVTDLR